MAPARLVVAMISEVWPGADPGLRDALTRARAGGAELAVLPELPLDPWFPATESARDADAEPPGGERHGRLARAAREVGIGVLGGAIVRDPASGRRHNTALTFDAGGQLVDSYRKVHLPAEPGFFETSHYVPGDRPPRRIDAFGLPIGVQVCSDAQRPTGSQVLAASGAAAILVPRATELATWESWRLVLRAIARTSACYLLSVNRPRAELGVGLGGPSLAVGPDGCVLAETSDELCVVELCMDAVERARRAYPGYLHRPAGLYAEAWRELAPED